MEKKRPEVEADKERPEEETWPAERRKGETERKRKEAAAEEQRKGGNVFVIKATSSAKRETANVGITVSTIFFTVLLFRVSVM